MMVVLDASAAAAIVKQSDTGRGFSEVLLAATAVLAPDLYIAETANVCWKLWLLDKKNPELYRAMAADCVDYVDHYVPSAELWREALIEAQNHVHAVYNMLYATLARRNDATLFTGDMKLRATCATMGVRIYDGCSEQN
ncbi:MAG: type II toxin-antitoxin system VapC family toxin [Desulfobulbaceae bacterium]|jgi:predicted nucleic acid-binding protein|nr:type II toxin-antitoxin system VapC family toxin [Desulfobulbaceae bacterium]